MMTMNGDEQCNPIYSPLFSSPDTGKEPLFIAFPVRTEEAAMAREPGSDDLLPLNRRGGGGKRAM
uniref:Uncharacterized protein n=1 Tax=Nelumbo nucifera TaxID=4432 RepID=A0A822ZNE0_NELNU|nr:TPA_asm: hypothetical protein HUJ06_016679 [Nelumbo nucifera]